KPVIVNDYAQWEHAVPTNREAGWHAALAVQLMRRGDSHGVRTVRSPYPLARFEEEDAGLLSLFGDQAVATLTTAELVEQQRRGGEEVGRPDRGERDLRCLSAPR